MLAAGRWRICGGRDEFHLADWMNYLWSPEGTCRCSLQRSAGQSVQAAGAPRRTRPSMTSRCSCLRACKGCCHTRWCPPHTEAPQSLQWQSSTAHTLNCRNSLSFAPIRCLFNGWWWVHWQCDTVHVTPVLKRLPYLASIHRCSYPGRPGRWHCWGRAGCDRVVEGSRRLCHWMLCESSHSWSWEC